MREVAWVIFDEIHYMRDKGFHPPRPQADMVQNAAWSGKKQSSSSPIRSITSSFPRQSPTPYNSHNGSPKSMVNPVTSYTLTFDRLPCNIISSRRAETGFSLSWMIVVDSARKIFRRRWLCWKIERGIIQITFSERGRRERLGRVVQMDRATMVIPLTTPSFYISRMALTLMIAPTDIYKIIKMIMLKNYNPVIVFSFSKKECEHLALKMSKLDFNDSTAPPPPHTPLPPTLSNQVLQKTKKNSSETSTPTP